MYKTENLNKDTFKPARFESDHTIMLRGQEIPYHTVCEDNLFYGDDGKPIASIFSYSYFRTDVENTANRPVLFGFNGGPGSASFYVHAGFFGTKRVKYEETDRETSLPPYEVIDNPDCLIDICDIVIVDPVGTGYGLLIDETKGKEFYGIEEDAEALLTFIESWCHRYNRMLSPKYLIGESYGCTRNATTVGISVNGGKDRAYGIRFDGVVMIGNTVSVGKYFNREVGVEESVLNFPTYAAINWYHNHVSEKPVEEFVAEAKGFADKDYLLGLYQGESLTGEARKQLVEKLCYYTGLTEKYFEDNALKIDDVTFRQEVIKESGRACSRYDGRVTRPLYYPMETERRHAQWDDATADRYDGYFYGALNGAILPYLNVKLDRQYLTFNNCHESWNYEVKNGVTGEQLRDAMNKTFGMRTFFANGWYDDCTYIGIVYYTLTHAGLPKDRCFVKGYKSGHMIYIGEDNCHELGDDIRKFILGKDPTK